MGKTPVALGDSRQASELISVSWEIRENQLVYLLVKQTGSWQLFPGFWSWSLPVFWYFWTQGMIWFGRFNAEVIPNKQPRDLLQIYWKHSVDLCYDKPEWINTNSFAQLLSLKFREQHTLQMVPRACGHLVVHLLPSARSQTRLSSAAPGPGAGGALMPAAGFPWPGRSAINHQWVLHFTSRLLWIA